MDKMYNYKGHTITKEDFGFTVFWEGEEILFATDKEAENFIDENVNQKGTRLMTTIQERYGSHILTITYFKNSAKVTVEDLAEIKFPLIYSDIMTKEKANAYLEIFKACGYIEVV